jgi:predicted nucleotidyltransferase
MCYDVVHSLPQAFQFPGICEAQITIDNSKYSTRGYFESTNDLRSSVIADGEVRGELAVIYKGDSAQFAFIPQEVDLLATIAAWLGEVIFKQELREWFGDKAYKQDMEPSKEEWAWRKEAAQKIAEACSLTDWHVVGIYLIGSVREHTAGAESDIDLLVHLKDRQAIKQLEAYFEGWEQALTNFPPNGSSLSKLVDVHYLTDSDLDENLSFATMITGKHPSSTRLV